MATYTNLLTLDCINTLKYAIFIKFTMKKIANRIDFRDKSLMSEGWVAFGGGSMFDSEKPETQMGEVAEMIAYPQVKFNRFLYSDDLVLVALKEPFTLTRYVGAICLPEKEIEPRQICVTAGWGYTSPGG